MQRVLQLYYKFLKNINPDPSFLMEFPVLLKFVRILRKTLKLFFKNGRLMSSISLLMLFFSSILLVTNMISIRVSVISFVYRASLIPDRSPTKFADITNTLMDYVFLLVALEWNFIFSFSFNSSLFETASILASAVTYCGKELSIKELVSRLNKSTKRSLVIWFYITLLDLGYWIFAIAFMIPSVLLLNPKFTISACFIIIFILAGVVRSYLSVVWTLALVVSVLEETSGIEALGKAAQLIKGSKLRGFFLKLFGAFSIWAFYGLAKIGTRALPANTVMLPALLLNLIMPANTIMLPSLLLNLIFCLINMFLQMAYTVLYYECKEIHGEDLEM